MHNQPEPVVGMAINWMEHIPGPGQKLRNKNLKEIKRTIGSGPFIITEVDKYTLRNQKIHYTVSIEREGIKIKYGSGRFGWCYFHPV